MSRKLPGPPIAWFALAGALVTAWLYRTFLADPNLMLWGQEIVDQSWQLREFGVSEIEAGRGVPLWNPYLYGGVPYVAILPGPVFYPTTALYFVMPLFRAIGWTFVLHTWLAGLFAWFAARSFGLGRPAAAVTGLGFMLTGFAVSMNEAGHDGRMFVIVLIPLAFGLLERGLNARRLPWFLAMGLVVACQIFTPHVQLMYYSSLVLSAYMLVRVAWIARDESDWRPAGRVFGYYALGFAAAAAIGAPQLLPTLELQEFAVRGGGETGYAFAASWAMPAQELTALVLPDLIGSLGTYWGANPFKQHTEYVGVVVAALAVIGLTCARRDRRVGLVAALAVLCVLFALGAATPVHRIAYWIVPMVGEFRAASMMMGPAAFLVALLAGVGWQRVLGTRPSGEAEVGGPGAAPPEPGRDVSGPLPWTWIVTLSAPALLLGVMAALGPEGLVRWVHTAWFPAGWAKQPGPEGIALLRASGWLMLGLWGAVWAFAHGVARGRVPPTGALLAVLALLALDLGRVDDRYVRAIDPAEAFAPDPVQAALQREIDPVARVLPLREPGGYAPNDMMLHDVRSVSGMQNFRLAWADRLIGGPTYRNLMAPALWPVFDLHYVITRQQVETPLLEEGPGGPRGTAWRVVDRYPHAWFPRRIEAEGDSATALARLTSRPDPAEFAFVAVDGPGRLPEGAAALPPAGAGRAAVASFTPNELVLEVDAERAGLLVISEIYHPNWRAALDGAEVPLYRADIALRAVEVPAGRHEVRLTYTAGTVRVGLIVGLLALAATVIGLVVSARRTGAEAAAGS